MTDPTYETPRADVDEPIADNPEQATDDTAGAYPDPDGEQDLGTDPGEYDDPDDDDDDPVNAPDAPDPEKAAG